jgi:hypothetical protein
MSKLVYITNFHVNIHRCLMWPENLHILWWLFLLLLLLCLLWWYFHEPSLRIKNEKILEGHFHLFTFRSDMRKIYGILSTLTSIHNMSMDDISILMWANFHINLGNHLYWHWAQKKVHVPISSDFLPLCVCVSVWKIE